MVKKKLCMGCHCLEIVHPVHVCWVTCKGPQLQKITTTHRTHRTHGTPSDTIAEVARSVVAGSCFKRPMQHIRAGPWHTFWNLKGPQLPPVFRGNEPPSIEHIEHMERINAPRPARQNDVCLLVQVNLQMFKEQSLPSTCGWGDSMRSMRSMRGGFIFRSPGPLQKVWFTCMTKFPGFGCSYFLRMCC